MRILGKISIYGTKASIDRLVSAAPILDGIVKQVGTVRKVPDVDSWCYASPWYRFNIESIDQDVRDFLIAHEQLGELLESDNKRIEYAVISLCPVGQDDQDLFACFISHETLKVLSRTRLALEIAPALVMPDARFWKSV